MKKAVIYSLVPSRTALKAVVTRDHTGVQILNHHSGDFCYDDHATAVEHGAVVTKQLTAPNDIAVVHIQFSQELFDELAATDDITACNEVATGWKITPAGCARLNAAADFVIEIFAVKKPAQEVTIIAGHYDTTQPAGDQTTVLGSLRTSCRGCPECN